MRKLVLISLDAMFDHDLSLLEQDSYLHELLRKGTVCTQVKTVFPAITYPAHTTLITGCDPASHGIGQNMPLQPEKEPDQRAWYLDAKHIQRETLFGAVKKMGGKCASMLWPVTCHDTNIRWNFPEAHTVRGENQVLKMLQCGTPAWVLMMEAVHGRQRKSAKEPHLSDYATVLACDVIKSGKPDLTAVHLIDLDDMRHHHGVDSSEAKAALQRLSERVRRIHETMQQTPGYEDALLAIVSDHGQADVNEPIELMALLKENGLDGAVQVQSNGMSAYLYDRGGAEQAVAWLRNHPTMAGVAKIYTRRELDEMHCIEGPAYAMEAAPGVVFSDLLPEAKMERATHGFGPGHPADNCLMAVVGQGVRAGAVLPTMPMRDVAPTLAELMGIPLPQAEGVSHAGQILRESNE